MRALRALPWWAWAATAMGSVLVACGGVLDGYSREVLLQFGSVFTLVVPVMLVERALEHRLQQSNAATTVAAVEASSNVFASADLSARGSLSATAEVTPHEYIDLVEVMRDRGYELIGSGGLGEVWGRGPDERVVLPRGDSQAHRDWYDTVKSRLLDADPGC